MVPKDQFVRNPSIIIIMLRLAITRLAAGVAPRSTPMLLCAPRPELAARWFTTAAPAEAAPADAAAAPVEHPGGLPVFRLPLSSALRFCFFEA
jgi:hypothetical protein